MTPIDVAPGSVVVGYNRSEDAVRALHWAAEQALVEGRPLSVVHAIAPSSTYQLTGIGAGYVDPGSINRSFHAAGTALLADAASMLAEQFPALDFSTHAFEGTPELVLEELSRTAASVVLGSRGRGPIATLLLGSVGVDVARSAACPVFVIRPHHPGKVRQGVLVGTDCGEHSRSTVEFAYRQASLRDQPLTVVYCVSGLDGPFNGLLAPDTPGASRPQRHLAESVAGMAEKFPDVKVRLGIGNGSVEQCLVHLGASMNLLVVGHHQRAAFGDLIGFGSFVPDVVERATCPVAVVGDAHVLEKVTR